MTRLCANCERKFCEGDCYTTEPEHDDEPTISKLTLDECRNLFGTVVQGDPFGPRWSGSAPSRVTPSRPSGHRYRKDKAA